MFHSLGIYHIYFSFASIFSLFFCIHILTSRVLYVTQLDYTFHLFAFLATKIYNTSCVFFFSQCMFLRFIQARRDQFKMTNRALFCCVPDFFLLFRTFSDRRQKKIQKEKEGRRVANGRKKRKIRRTYAKKIVIVQDRILFFSIYFALGSLLNVLFLFIHYSFFYVSSQIRNYQFLLTFYYHLSR